MEGPSSLASSESVAGPTKIIRKIVPVRPHPFHRASNRYVCLTCGRIFRSPRVLVQHQQSHFRGKEAVVTPSTHLPHGEWRSFWQRPRYSSPPIDQQSISRNEVDQPRLIGGPIGLQPGNVLSPCEVRQNIRKAMKALRDHALNLHHSNPIKRNLMALLPVPSRLVERALVPPSNPNPNPSLKNLLPPPASNPILKDSLHNYDPSSPRKGAFSLHQPRALGPFPIEESSGSNKIACPWTALLIGSEKNAHYGPRVIAKKPKDSDMELDLDLHL